VALEHCFALASRDSACFAIDGLLLTAAAANQLPVESNYQKATKDAALSISQTNDARTMLHAALIYYAVAEAKVAHKQPASSEIKLGSEILKRVIETNQKYPRALAMLGGFRVFESRQLKDRSQRSQILREAQKDFQQAFVGNPLLRNHYGSLAAEAERALQAPPAP
jgi:hypothetical protein